MVTFVSNPGFFDGFDELRREMDSLFASAIGPASIRAAARGSFPAVNVGETPEQVDIYLFAPGIDPKKIDISLDDKVLTVAGERPAQSSSDKAHLRERFSGSFRRAVNLADDIDPERVEARYTDGVLHITVGRKAAVQARRIEIK
jgi:HSP20 family protein